MSKVDEITKRANFMINDNSCDLTIENENLMLRLFLSVVKKSLLFFMIKRINVVV